MRSFLPRDLASHKLSTRRVVIAIFYPDIKDLSWHFGGPGGSTKIAKLKEATVVKNPHDITRERVAQENIVF